MVASKQSTLIAFGESRKNLWLEHFRIQTFVNVFTVYGETILTAHGRNLPIGKIFNPPRWLAGQCSCSGRLMCWFWLRQSQSLRTRAARKFRGGQVSNWRHRVYRERLFTDLFSRFVFSMINPKIIEASVLSWRPPAPITFWGLVDLSLQHLITNHQLAKFHEKKHPERIILFVMLFIDHPSNKKNRKEVSNKRDCSLWTWA